MQLTFSQPADAILGRYIQSREKLVAVLAALPGHCFIDGKVGRIPGNDELVLRSPDYPPMTVPHAQFSDPTRLGHVLEEWASSRPG
jgi:hypothetical protein